VSNCVALVESVNSDTPLELPHDQGFTLTRGTVVHNDLGAAWGITLVYEGLANGKTFTFIAQPAADVEPWCPKGPMITESRQLNRTICLYTFPGGGTAAFTRNGVRYSISPTFGSYADVPVSGALRTAMIQMISTVRS